MGYFPNGTEGMIYDEEMCSRCVHQKPDDGGCAVWLLHMIYNYDQLDKGQEKLKTALDILIPVGEDGLSNEKCTMFHDKNTYDRRRKE